MKKTTLKQFYTLAEKMLNDNGITISLENTLSVQVEIEKKENEKIPEIDYVIRYRITKDDRNSIFAYGANHNKALEMFQQSINEFLKIEDKQTDIIID